MYKDVIEFWFTELSPKQWWHKDPELDSIIQQRFEKLLLKAKAAELFSWRDSPLGSLAEVIVLDQFSRNIYRDKAEAFASDAMALALAQVAISKGVDQQLPDEQRAFLYMPFMHSESAMIHVEAVELFSRLSNKNNLAFEYQHKAIIDKFGRYPHRNNILQRQSTALELEFLQQPNSSF
ncbi:DUF924 family protein [Shewanella gaetbuli]